MNKVALGYKYLSSIYPVKRLYHGFITSNLCGEEIPVSCLMFFLNFSNEQIRINTCHVKHLLEIIQSKIWTLDGSVCSEFKQQTGPILIC